MKSEGNSDRHREWSGPEGEGERRKDQLENLRAHITIPIDRVGIEIGHMPLIDRRVIIGIPGRRRRK